MFTNHDTIKKAIIRSQHCQRNWDLSKEISEVDLNLFMTAITQCPSKQNVAHYKVHAITNRDIIEQIHDHTRGFTTSYIPYSAETNSQVLANLLVVFEKNPPDLINRKDKERNDETRLIAKGQSTAEIDRLVLRDCQMAVGIAAGYLNVIASMLDYATGCCACFSTAPIQKILGIDNEILLMMGVGYKNSNLNRRIHHVNQNFTFPTKAKQEIQIKYYP